MDLRLAMWIAINQNKAKKIIFWTTNEGNIRPKASQKIQKWAKRLSYSIYGSPWRWRHIIIDIHKANENGGVQPTGTSMGSL